MRKFAVAVAVTLATTSLHCHAIDGHNGVKFSMTQQQVEAMGFMCNPHTKPDRSSLATCRHMDMTGTAFSVPTRNYAVVIGNDKRVSFIGADLIAVRMRRPNTACSRQRLRSPSRCGSFRAFGRLGISRITTKRDRSSLCGTGPETCGYGRLFSSEVVERQHRNEGPTHAGVVGEGNEAWRNTASGIAKGPR